jgi:hypothetical protein
VVARIWGGRAALATALCFGVASVWILTNQVARISPFIVCIGICVAGLLAVSSLAQPRRVFLLVVAILPLEATLVVEAGFSITLAYMLIPVMIIALLIRRESVPIDQTESKLALAYLAVCAFSLCIAFLIHQPDFRASGIMAMRASSLRPFVQFGLIGLHFAFFLLVLKYALCEKSLISSIRLYITIAVVLAAAGIYQTAAVMLDLPLQDFTFAVGSTTEQTAKYGETRFYSALIANFAPRGTFRESLHFSHYLNSVVPLLLTLFLYKKRLPERWKTRIPSLLMFLPVAALFLTLSRSGWVACVGGLLFLGVFLPKAQILRVGGLLVLLLLGTVSIFQVSGLFENADSIFDLIALRMDGELLLADPRIEQGQVLLSTWLQHPFLGIGIGNYGIFAASALGTPLLISANSVFLCALVENGIPGFVLLTSLPLLFFFRLWRLAPRVRDYAAYPYLIGIGAGVFAMTTQYFTFGDRPGLYYLFALALGFALLRHLKGEPKPVTN